MLQYYERRGVQVHGVKTQNADGIILLPATYICTCTSIETAQRVVDLLNQLVSEIEASRVTFVQ